ncbi:hypothetical protein XELAEV_18039457mg [Xenopus laevis]|uniref:Uncharacterized protein n=1 Tax=Xenopus laevis TaxID=8355 RepID=A0A974H8D3_XENLA|nr:hypothetical protein XELAEV_18039457mg [Xenopus laevis]
MQSYPRTVMCVGRVIVGTHTIQKAETFVVENKIMQSPQAEQNVLPNVGLGTVLAFNSGFILNFMLPFTLTINSFFLFFFFFFLTFACK